MSLLTKRILLAGSPLIAGLSFWLLLGTPLLHPERDTPTRTTPEGFADSFDSDHPTPQHNPPPLPTPELTAQPKPAAAFGCWLVSGKQDLLTATWQDTCQVELTPPPRFPVEFDWPSDTVVLHANTAGAPDRSHEQTEITVSRETAAKGAGGLLYLPTNADGGGYYVAGWVSPNAETRTWAVGLYGAQPQSVATSGGRVYLSPEFKQKVRHRVVRAAPPEVDNIQPATPDTEEPPILATPRLPRALELD